MRIGIGRRQAHAQQRLRQDIAHQFDAGWHLRLPVVFEARTGEAIRGDQYQALDPLRVARRKTPGDSSAHRVADQRRAGYTQMVHQRRQQLHAALVGVVAGGIGRAQSGTRKIKADDAVMIRQQARPGFPGVETRAKAMQQDDRRGVFRAAVAHVQRHAGHLDKIARGGQVPGLESRPVAIRGPKPQAHDNQQRQHGARDHQDFQVIWAPADALSDFAGAGAGAGRRHTLASHGCWSNGKPVGR